MSFKKIIYYFVVLCFTAISFNVQLNAEQPVSIEKLNDENFEGTISKGRVVVDFYADWCGPCRKLVPIIQQLSKEMSGSVTFVKVNIEEAPSVSSKYKVSSLPTLILFNNGKEVNRRVGGCDEKTLRNFANSAS